ncbi:MAG: hypothetical protein P8125_09360, partial [Gemmatimonadota bacterium]
MRRRRSSLPSIPVLHVPPVLRDVPVQLAQQVALDIDVQHQVLRLVYFLNFNKPDSRNMLFRVTASAIEALTTAAKPAYVIFSNPARRIAWVIPVKDMLARHEEVFGEKFEPQDLVLNIDI